MNLKTKRLLIASALIIIAPLALYSSISKYVQRSGAGNWPHVKGTVIFSGVAEQTRYNKQNKSTFSSRTNTRYIQRIKYSYVVNNSEYIGKNFNLNESRSLFDGTGRIFSSKKVAKQAAIKLSKGAEVDVYYNPKNPEIASLSYKDATFMPIIFAIVFLGFAVLTILIALEKIKPENLSWRKNS